MKITRSADGNYSIACTRDELMVLNNALNNIPQAVDEYEYTTLIGATKADTNALLDIISGALNAA